MDERVLKLEQQVASLTIALKHLAVMSKLDHDALTDLGVLALTNNIAIKDARKQIQRLEDKSRRTFVSQN